MRKIFKSLALISILGALMLGTTACGNNQDSEDSMEKYVKSDEVQSTIETLKESLGSTLDIDIKGEDNKLIYEYAYTSQIEDVESAKSTLDSGLEAQKTTFVNVANSLKDAVDVENPVVVVRYLNADGTLITEAEYEAE